MSQRKSGFARVPSELYQTPAWVLDALAEHVELHGISVWEPACGQGQMVRAMRAHGAAVFGTDVQDHGFADMWCLHDFIRGPLDDAPRYDAIITNPPYGPNGRLAVKFIERGLARLPPGGFMALLLQADFDSASGRTELFHDCQDFAGRVVLNRRIVWFEPPPPEPGEKRPSGPSQNHTWFLWHRPHIWTGAAPFTLYAKGPADAE